MRPLKSIIFLLCAAATAWSSEGPKQISSGGQTLLVYTLGEGDRRLRYTPSPDHHPPRLHLVEYRQKTGVRDRILTQRRAILGWSGFDPSRIDWENLSGTVGSPISVGDALVVDLAAFRIEGLDSPLRLRSLVSESGDENHERPACFQGSAVSEPLEDSVWSSLAPGIRPETRSDLQFASIDASLGWTGDLTTERINSGNEDIFLLPDVSEDCKTLGIEVLEMRPLVNFLSKDRITPALRQRLEEIAALPGVESEFKTDRFDRPIFRFLGPLVCWSAANGWEKGFRPALCRVPLELLETDGALGFLEEGFHRELALQYTASHAHGDYIWQHTIARDGDLWIASPPSFEVDLVRIDTSLLTWHALSPSRSRLKEVVVSLWQLDRSLVDEKITPIRRSDEWFTPDRDLTWLVKRTDGVGEPKIWADIRFELTGGEEVEWVGNLENLYRYTERSLYIELIDFDWDF